MIEKSKNKETITLLDLSANDSDISDLILTSKKKKVKRRHRSNGLLKIKQDNSCGFKTCKMKVVLLWLTGVIIMIWIIILSWLTLTLLGEVRRMDISLKSVIAGSEGVPDALQTCHTLNRNFKNNITQVSDEIQILNKSLSRFSVEISKFQLELEQVQVSLKSAPELKSVPSTVKALQDSIGQLEIDIHELQTIYKTLKETTLNLQNSELKQQKSLTTLQNTLMSLSNATHQSKTNPSNGNVEEIRKLWNAVTQLSKNLVHINQTLTMNITWAQEDVTYDHKKIVSLQDMAQNASSQILTLQQECLKKKDQETLQNMIYSLSNRVDKVIKKSNTNRQEPLHRLYAVPKNFTELRNSPFADRKHQNLITEINNQTSVRENIKNLETTTRFFYKTTVTQEPLFLKKSMFTRQLFIKGN